MGRPGVPGGRLCPRTGTAARAGLGCGVRHRPGSAVRTASRVRQWVAVLPAPLGRLATAVLATEMLTTEIEAAGPPAGVRELGLPDP